MQNSPILEPKVESITCQDGTEKSFIFSKFPATAGREIISAYPVSNLPKLGDYGVSEATMLKLMSHVAVQTEAGPLRLSTRALVDNHVPDWEALAKIEMGMLEYNCSFFQAGAVPGFIDLLLEKAAPMLSKILTSSLQALSEANTQLGSNSETA